MSHQHLNPEEIRKITSIIEKYSLDKHSRDTVMKIADEINEHLGIDKGRAKSIATALFKC